MDRTTTPPDLSPYSTAPHYNIQAVEKAAGISSRTLRSWERRYGTPSPVRDGSGRRLYSERDVAVIRWLMERIEQGVTIGRAVGLLSAPSDTEPAQGQLLDFERLQLRLLQAIDWMDEEEVSGILAESLRQSPVERLVLDLIQPTLYRVGELWASGHLSVASEHFGTHMLRSFLADLLRRSPDPWRPHHVFVGCAPGELHDLGALVLALFLRRAGFRVIYLGGNLPGGELPADLARLRPAALCLSATKKTAARELRTLFASLGATFRGVLAFGGSAFAHDPDLVSSVPGVFLGTDVREAANTLADVLTDADHRRAASGDTADASGTA